MEKKTIQIDIENTAELSPYISSRVEISELDANIMLAGMMIDTNRFQMPNGTRFLEGLAAKAAEYYRRKARS